MLQICNMSFGMICSTPGLRLTIRIVRVASGRGIQCGAHQRNECCGAFFIARTVRRGEIPFLRMEQPSFRWVPI